ncbi:hypothetical protein RCL1_002362 [Eukaryota sp. TZLM3-RCL]
MPSENAISFFENTLNEIRESGLWKHERVITSAQGAEVTVAGSDKPLLNFCANNYLGLSNHPEVIQAAKDMMDRRGYGLSSVRFICGTQDIHKELEAKISSFYGTKDTILYAACFDANAGLFETILGPEDAVISADLNHASIIDGVRLCKAKRLRYVHDDMTDLRAKLEEARDCRIRLITTDSSFSMDGKVAPLDQIYELAQEYNALIHIDECHSSGLLAHPEHKGVGVPSLFNLHGKIDIITSTLGKALGGAMAGFTTSIHPQIIDLLRQRSRTYLFSNSVCPAVVGGSLKVFDLLSSSSELVDRIQANTRQFRTAMKAAGFTISGHDMHPIAPVMFGDARLAAEFAEEMKARGIYVIAFSYPVVPKGKARIRVQMSAAHSTEQVQRLIDAFIEVGRSLKVIN